MAQQEKVMPLISTDILINVNTYVKTEEIPHSLILGNARL